MSNQPSFKIICTSVHHNNTRRIAETICQPLNATLHSTEEARTLELRDSDVVGFGSGIYFGRHHTSLLRLADDWPKRPCRVFIFSTAGLPFLRWVQHSALRRRLVRHGCEIIGEFCCRGWDTVGPLWLMGGINRKHPNAKDVEKAKKFAELLREAVQVPPRPVHK